MYLCLEPVVILAADFLATEATGVLQLHTALLIKPVLQTHREIGLIPSVDRCIAIVGLTRGYEVKGASHRDAGSDITTTGAYLTILTTEPLCTDAGRTGLLVLTR